MEILMVETCTQSLDVQPAYKCNMSVYEKDFSSSFKSSLKAVFILFNVTFKLR